jgi:hypothetical protein
MTQRQGLVVGIPKAGTSLDPSVVENTAETGGAWGGFGIPGMQRGTPDEEGKKKQESLCKGEEKRDRQIMLDAGDVDGQKSLKGLSENILLEKAKASIKAIVREQLTADRPERVEVISAALQRQGGVMFTLNSKETRTG